jgi:hypothetical protein
MRIKKKSIFVSTESNYILKKFKKLKFSDKAEWRLLVSVSKAKADAWMCQVGSALPAGC